MSRKSLEDVEKRQYGPKPSILERDAVRETLQERPGGLDGRDEAVALDGAWELIEGGNVDRVSAAEWAGAISAKVPGGIHKALFVAGILPDPLVGKNDALAREKSFQTWWMRKRFTRPEGFAKARLEFGGVCESCTVWLNGVLLGSHKGMFGGPDFDVSEILQDENVLVVKINPAPRRMRGDTGELNDFFHGMNIGWTDTVVFNCVYGWHYASIPALGIWRSVRLVPVPRVEMSPVQLATTDIDKGLVRVSATLSGPEGGFSGELSLSIEPENFEGPALGFTTTVRSPRMRHPFCYEFQVPDFRPWWPNGIGEQNLYRVVVRYQDAEGSRSEYRCIFGIRTVEMRPLSDGPKEDVYNWTFVLNGRPMFIKGANWCTLDVLMDFTRERYDRFLTLAREQHLQLLRAWGGGLLETDDFYDLCDRKGIMVMQEWPTAWDSQKVQDPVALRDTVARNTVRLRNHASLAIWTGGNESAHPTDVVMDMIGKMTYELDGTRVFHRNDPWGGSSHDYSVYWGRKDFDVNLEYTAPFIGEFGFASSPNRESARRYLAPAEFGIWPPMKGGGVEHHTPVFNTKGDMEIQNQYVPQFLPNTSLDHFITATQLCQVVTLRHTLELARTRWPEATGACYYKLTDVFPSVSWSTVDYFGVPKMAYFAVQDSFSPLHACVLLKTLKPAGTAQTLPVHLLDDADALAGKDWQVVVRIFDKALAACGRETFAGQGGIDRTRLLGTVRIDESTASSAPLFLVVEVRVAEEVVDRTFYWLNFAAEPGCLFRLPTARLTATRTDRGIRVRNESDLPAVAVHLVCEEISDAIRMEDDFFWLDAGEERQIRTNRTDIAGVAAWNATLRACEDGTAGG